MDVSYVWLNRYDFYAMKHIVIYFIIKINE